MARLVVVGFSGWLLLSPAMMLAAEIHQAAQTGGVARVKVLLSKAPDEVNSRLADGTTPLHLAATSKNSAMAGVLIAAGADVNAVNSSGYTPLHCAAYANSTNVATLLLSKGANAGLKTRSGLSPFMLAVKEQAADVGRLLAAQTGTTYNETFLDANFLEGEKAMNSGDMARAYSILSQAVKDNPSDERANFALGMVCGSLKDLSRAQLAFDRVLQLNDGNDRARFELARILLERGQFEQAKKEFSTVLSHEPPPGVKGNIESYLSRVQKRERKMSLQGRLNFGVFNDSNVNVGPDSDVINISPIVFGTETLHTLTLEESSKPTKVQGMYAMAEGEMLRDMGQPGSWLSAGNISCYRNLLDGDEAHESLFAQAQLGARNNWRKVVLQLPMSVGHIDYAGDPLVNMYGMDPSLFLAGEGHLWSLLSALSAEYRDYDSLDDRDGVYVSAGETYRCYWGEQRHSLMFGVSLSHDYTRVEPYENTTLTWILSGEFKLPRSFQIYGSTRFSDARYEAKESLATEIRNDRQQQFTAGINKVIRTGWAVDLNLQKTHNESSFDLYTYDRELTTLSTTISF